MALRILNKTEPARAKKAVVTDDKRGGLVTLKPDLSLPKGYLSKSSIECYQRCPKQFEFRYIRGIISPPGVALVEGTAHGNALNMNNEHFIEKGKNVKAALVVERFKDEFSDRSHEIPKSEWASSGDKQADVFRRGERMLNVYMDKLAPQLRPVHVEKRVEVLMGGVPVMGYTDMEEERSVWDYKAVGKAYSQKDADADLQFSIYSKGTKKKKGGFICLTKSNSTVNVVKTERGVGDLAAADALVASVADAIRKGAFPMCSPKAWNCSKRFCGFYERCRGQYLRG